MSSTPSVAGSWRRRAAGRVDGAADHRRETWGGARGCSGGGGGDRSRWETVQLVGDSVKKTRQQSKWEVCNCERFFPVWVCDDVGNRGGSGDEPHTDPPCSHAVPPCTHTCTTPSHDPWGTRPPTRQPATHSSRNPRRSCPLSWFPHESKS